MADLSITATSVISQGGAKRKTGTAGVSITAGQVLCVDTDGRMILASDASAVLAKVAGIALHASSPNQPIEYQYDGDIAFNAVLAVGKHYVLSTAGAIAPVDDVAGGEFDSALGRAISTTVLRLNILAATVAAAGAVA